MHCILCALSGVAHVWLLLVMNTSILPPAATKHVLPRPAGLCEGLMHLANDKMMRSRVAAGEQLGFNSNGCRSFGAYVAWALSFVMSPC
jgi:hypothetical protein